MTVRARKRQVLDLQVAINNVAAGLFDLRRDPAFARAAQLVDTLAAEVEMIAKQRKFR